MKRLNQFTLAALLATGLVFTFSAMAAEEKKAEKAKPYPLKTCVVSDEKLGEMGDPYVFTQDNQEVKLCCKSCLKEFKKEPAKFIKKIEDAEKAPKAAKKS